MNLLNFKAENVKWWALSGFIKNRKGFIILYINTVNLSQITTKNDPLAVKFMKKIRSFGFFVIGIKKIVVLH